MSRQEKAPRKGWSEEGFTGKPFIVKAPGQMFLLPRLVEFDIHALGYEERQGRADRAGQHFGEECVLGENSRSSTITAVTECVLLEIERQVIRDLASENGKLLSFLNTEMNLGHERILKSKWGMKKKGESKKSEEKKENVGRSIQTFLTDLFPSSSNKETT